MSDAAKSGKEFQKLVLILDALREERGCPWDREQDEKSITNYFLEEVYEAVDAILSEDAQSLAEELGDVLMEVVFLSRINKEQKKFTILKVLEGINKKMVDRHPHVFANKKIATSEKVVDEWNRQKKEEKERISVLDGLAKCFPALLEAFLIGKRVSHFGFDWSHSLDALKKTKEELAEFEKAVQNKKRDEISKEVGDIFFSLVNVSRHLGVNPEIALRQTNKKFIQRFKYIEQQLAERGKNLKEASLEEMDKFWEEAKKKIN